MKLRTRLTIKNTVATASVLAVVFIIISVVSEHGRRRAFYSDLKGEAITKAHLYLQHRVDAETMHDIYLNNRRFINEVEVAVYDTAFVMLYHDAAEIDIIKEDRAMINRIVREGEVEFDVGRYYALGLVYTFEGRDYVVTAAAYDGVGYANRQTLRCTLLVLFGVGVLLLFVAGLVMASASLKPMNELLAKLESSNAAQKQFVANVSHELRTPLAAIRAQLDLSLQKERSSEQYRAAIEAALQDAKNMTSLVDGLLNLAKADYQREGIKMQDIRLDELLLDVRQSLLAAHEGYRIELVFDGEASELDDRLITVHGNVYLLGIALCNLIDNNCKYSANRTSIVHITSWQEHAIVRMSDNGAGMTQSDVAQLFTLFYRGQQAGTVEGHGIGMTLAQKIIHLHDGQLAVHSQTGEGTTFVVKLPHV